MLQAVTDPDNEFECRVRFAPTGEGSVQIAIDLFKAATERRMATSTAFHRFTCDDEAMPFARGILATYGETGMLPNLCLPVTEWRQIAA